MAVVSDQIFVGGVVGHDMAQTNFSKSGEQARQRKPPTGRDRDIVLRVLRCVAATIATVVIVRDRLTQGIDAADRPVGAIGHVELQ